MERFKCGDGPLIPNPMISDFLIY